MAIRIVSNISSAYNAFEAFLRDVIRWAIRESLHKEWVTEKNGAPPCKQCQYLDGKTVDVDVNFPAPSNDMGPPLHPNCRCKIKHVIPGRRSVDIDM